MHRMFTNTMHQINKLEYNVHYIIVAQMAEHIHVMCNVL